MLILEELEYARARGAEPLAEVLGYAATSDAIHIAAPDPEGSGAARCMTLAMQRAGVTPSDIGYINPHGTARWWATRPRRRRSSTPLAITLTAWRSAPQSR